MLRSRFLLTITIIATPLLIGSRVRSDAAEELPLDLESLLVVDVLGSIGEEEGRLQRDGYRSTIKSNAFSTTVKPSTLGRIALRYIEWAGDGFQSIVVDWILVDSEASATSSFSVR